MKAVVLRMTVAALATFLGGAFVVPGIRSAIAGGPVSAPSMMDPWASWIAMWAIVAVVGPSMAEVVILLIGKMRRRR